MNEDYRLIVVLQELNEDKFHYGNRLFTHNIVITDAVHLIYFFNREEERRKIKPHGGYGNDLALYFILMVHTHLYTHVRVLTTT